MANSIILFPGHKDYNYEINEIDKINFLFMINIYSILYSVIKINFL